MKPLIAIDLFAGAGGLSTGLHDAGWKVPLAVEIEKDFAATYRVNHPTTMMLQRDIAHIDFADAIRELGIRDGVDLVAGGPPCQGFSTVGKKDLCDPRNSLFGQFLRAVDELQPRAVLFENVAGFKTMYAGRVHDIVMNELVDRGFDVQSFLLDAVDFGLPQLRKRMILMGARGGVRVRRPEPTHSDLEMLGLPGFVTVSEAISDLPPLGTADSSDRYQTEPKTAYQAAMRGSAIELTEHNSSNYGPRMQTILRSVPGGGSVLDLPEQLRPKGYFANTYARLWGDRPAPTITRNFGTPSSSRCIHPTQHRALSTREGARLQGFPDSYAFTGPKTSKNLQIGNAVPPLLARVLGDALAGVLAGKADKVGPKKESKRQGRSHAHVVGVVR